VRDADEDPGPSPAGAPARGQLLPGMGLLGSSDFVLRERGSPALGSLQSGTEVINVMPGLLFTCLIIPICPSHQPFLVPFLFNLKETQNNKQRTNICTNNQKVIYRLKILVNSV